MEIHVTLGRIITINCIEQVHRTVNKSTHNFVSFQQGLSSLVVACSFTLFLLSLYILDGWLFLQNRTWDSRLERPYRILKGKGNTSLNEW